MIRALVLAFGQLTDPPSRRVVWIGVLGAILGFIGLAVGIGVLLNAFAAVGIAWIDELIPVAGGLASFLLAWLLFPAAVITVSSLLLDDVVDRVEARHYPHLGTAPRLSWLTGVGSALRLALIVVAINLLALPLYLFAPGLNLVVYYGINGYLLGREYFELVANRRLGIADARVLRRRHPMRPFLAGVLIAFLSSVPLINLFLPVIAGALMVHVFHGLTSRSA
jgi:CysZ protein